jgi:hypothetical protein
MECQMGHAHFILSLSLSHLHAFFRLGLESNEDGCEPNDMSKISFFFSSNAHAQRHYYCRHLEQKKIKSLLKKSFEGDAISFFMYNL